MGERITVADAFTARPFRGNPAAVCILDGPADESWMQAVAAEMNLAETSFLHPEAGGYRLRWFTPSVEVDLCGHATLAAAHVLWEQGRLDADAPARFQTRGGPLSARLRDGWIELDFPADPPEAVAAPEELPASLRDEAVWIGKNGRDLFVEMATEAAVRSLRVDSPHWPLLDARGTIVTARSENPELDFVSRFFAPRVGIPEDPVTGSAHCALGPYWASKLNKREVTGYQASPRGGIVRVTPRGERVLITGQAVTVWRGDLSAGAGSYG